MAQLTYWAQWAGTGQLVIYQRYDHTECEVVLKLYGIDYYTQYYCALESVAMRTRQLLARLNFYRMYRINCL